MPQHIATFYKFMKYSGLMNATFDGESKTYLVKRSLAYCVFHASIQGSLVASFVATYRNRKYILIGDYMETEHYYNFIAMQLALVSHVILRMWLICNQQKNLQLLELCCKLKRKCLVADVARHSDYPKVLLITFVATAILYIFNLVIVLYEQRSGLNGSSVLTWSIFTYCCIIMSLVSYVYIFIVMTISKKLNWIARMCDELLLQANNKLSKRDLMQLQNLLNLYNDITHTACHEVNYIYGIAILISAISLINESIWDAYELAVSRTETYYLYQIQTIMWMAPIYIYLIVALLNSNVSEEVSKYNYKFVCIANFKRTILKYHNLCDMIRTLLIRK